jgi:alkanesulfonate monooxygenase SsuD/methylene tetrahydromethanopterin reductase-like flavin-dependent oxidoreductase (luciferase family)
VAGPPPSTDGGLVEFGVFDWVDTRGGEVPLHRVYDERLELAAAADREGFALYHVAEHHCTPLGMAPSPSVFLAALARATSRIRLGPLVFLLPLYHPLRLVEEICMLDHLSGGRLEVGVGRGVSPYELGHYGVDADDSRRLFSQRLREVLAGLRGDGTPFGDAPIVLRAQQRPYPPLWYATTIPESVRWAAEQGFHLAGLGPAAAYRSNVELYRRTWEAHRHDPGRANGHVERPRIGLNRQVVVADSDAEALAVARAAHPVWADSFIRLWAANGDDRYADRISLEGALAAGTLVAGSPDTVRRQVAAQVAEAGISYWISAFAWGGLTPAQSLRSLELFAREVAPAFAPRRGATGPGVSAAAADPLAVPPPA